MKIKDMFIPYRVFSVNIINKNIVNKNNPSTYFPIFLLKSSISLQFMIGYKWLNYLMKLRSHGKNKLYIFIDVALLLLQFPTCCLCLYDAHIWSCLLHTLQECLPEITSVQTQCLQHILNVLSIRSWFGAYICTQHVVHSWPQCFHIFSSGAFWKSHILVVV